MNPGLAMLVDELAEKCHTIVINHPSSKWNGDSDFLPDRYSFSQFFLSEFPGWALKIGNLEIQSVHLCDYAMSLDVLFSGEHVFGGYIMFMDEEEIAEQEKETPLIPLECIEAVIKKYAPGRWELVVNQIYSEMDSRSI